MQNPLHNPFFVVVRAELRFNSQRVAPYALAVLFSLNAWLWWSGGPAARLGWATNSDFYIVHCMSGFVFISTPFFVALLMGEAVLRDLRLEAHSLLLATPLRRSEYLLGKFCGNFLTLVLCSACFALTLCLLQALRVAGMSVLPWRVLPYLKHFLVLVVISHLLMAAYCFTIGTLTRNVKFVYLAILAGYFLLIFFGYFFSQYAPSWNQWLSLVGPVNGFNPYRHSTEFINQFVNVYGTEFVVNRLGVTALAAALLGLLVWRFSKASVDGGSASPFETGLRLTAQPERISFESDFVFAPAAAPVVNAPRQSIAIPSAQLASSGARAGWRQFAAALRAEFRLLRHERSLIVLAPLVVLLASVELGATGNSISYAVNSAQALLLLLSAILFFYAGEALHREQELRVEAILWSAPPPNGILLGAKFAALLALALGLILLVLIAALCLQAYRGLLPLTPLPYLIVYGIVLLPSLIFVLGATVALHVLLRNKYLAHIVGLGLGGGLIWLWLHGYVNGLYNPVLYRLWTYEELIGSKLVYVLWQRLYWLALTLTCLATAHWFYPRRVDSKQALLVALLAAVVALVCGWRLNG